MRIGRNEKGFTLLEILVAATLLSVGLLGAAGLIGAIMSGNRTSNMVTTATTLAQDRMEEIKRRGYDNVTPTTFADEDPVTNFPFYKRVTSVDPNNPPGGNMKTITVTVSWDADASSVVLETILTQESG